MSSRFFSRNKKFSITFNKDSTEAKLMSISRGESTPMIVKKYVLEKEEFTPNKFHREKQLYKHILGDAIKDKKMTMKEFNEFAVNHKLINKLGLLVDTLATEKEE